MKCSICKTEGHNKNKCPEKIILIIQMKTEN